MLGYRVATRGGPGVSGGETDSTYVVRTGRNARRFRPALLAGLTVSVLFHATVLLLWRSATPFAAPDVAGGRPAASMAGGGGELQAMRVRLPDRIEVPPPPQPVVAVDVPPVEVREPSSSLPGLELSPAAQIALRPGIGGGTGARDGGVGSGKDDYVSPMPRSILPHWDPPSSVRGLEVTVRVHVDARGKPTGVVQLVPPTPDRRFNREIEDRVRKMEYQPARRNGEAVPGWAEITFIF